MSNQINNVIKMLRDLYVSIMLWVVASSSDTI